MHNVDNLGQMVRVPEPAHLRAEFAAAVIAPRSPAIASLKSLRRSELARISRMQHERINEVTGMDVSIAIASLSDGVIRVLVQRAATKAGAPANWTERAGVFALGGYGRGELNPGSDIDLMVVGLETPRPAWLTALDAELQPSLWDVGFQVGASCRILPELERVIAEDFVTATAILEQRPLVAGEAPVAAMRDLLLRFRRKRSSLFLRYKLDELQTRRGPGASIFRLEPNLKTNPGGLRDVQLLRNIAFIAHGSRNLLALRELGSIADDDIRDLYAANDHLLGLRSLLHFRHEGRRQDTLQLPDQLALAPVLGFSGSGRLLGVEHMMKAHYAKTLHVHRVIELAVSRLKALGHLGRRRLLILTRRRLDEHFTVIDGKVYLADAKFWDKPEVPRLLLAMARAAQRRNARLSLELQREIRSRLHLFGDEFRSDPACGRIFLEILGEMGRVRPILSDLQGCGLLDTYLPEFARVRCHMQFDSYHQYTVDEHTLIALGNLDAFAAGRERGLPGMRECWPRLRRLDLLGLGLLLHDVGKFMGSGHVPRGALMVGPVARRLGLSEEEEDVVHFLVARHVRLSDASRMRNIHDPALLRTLASEIGDQERLDLLYCLTWADAKAVGEGVLTGWQEELLGELRRSLSAILGPGEESGHGSRRRRMLETLLAAGQSAESAQSFLDTLPDAYAFQVTGDDVVTHHALLAQARGDGVAVRLAENGGTLAVSMAMKDRSGLFADVAAAFTGNGFDIISARSATTTDGYILDEFRLSCGAASRLTDPEVHARLIKDLADAVLQRVPAERFLSRRSDVMAYDRPADSGFNEVEVKADQVTSERSSILDIRVKDRVGLLSRMCQNLSNQGLNIDYALINTFGDVARDTLYVSRAGGKLSETEVQAAVTELRRHLVAQAGTTAAS